MPEFFRVSFDKGELEVLRRACALRSGREDRRLDEAASGPLEEVVEQEGKADDMQLIRSTVSIFKPGQTILITKEDLLLIEKCLEDFNSPMKAGIVAKIDGAMRPSGAGRR